MWVTSLAESRHGKGSRHYSGLAVDLRIWDLKSPAVACKEIAGRLGLEFDVVLEKDHIHIEYDPDTA